MTIRMHEGDLPANFDFGPVVAIDTETMGLQVGRDRLCVVQLSRGDGNAEVVRIASGQREAPVLASMLSDPNVLKLFHFGNSDMLELSLESKHTDTHVHQIVQYNV